MKIACQIWFQLMQEKANENNFILWNECSPEATVWMYDIPIIAEYVTCNFLMHCIVRWEVPFRVWVIVRNYDKVKKMRNEFFIARETLLDDI
jgi:hypothetical protein